MLPPTFVLALAVSRSRSTFSCRSPWTRTDRANLTGGVFTPLARLAPGVLSVQAQTELDALAANANRRLDEKHLDSS